MAMPMKSSEAIVTSTERPVPRWAERFAHLIPLIALPVCLWRIPIAFGFTMGTGLPPIDGPLWVSISYVGGLSVVSELFALACFSLVRPWGEVLPGWVPVFGGKRVPPYLVIVPAAIGGLAITAVLISWFLSTFQLAGFERDQFDNVWWELLAVSSSGLFSLCGPMVLALTYAYYRRRCHPEG
ncbi:hypothetical protein ACFZAG_26615 [Streptomyces sp. NPDC012403]|uniref:hypothetical protein n=1 Tax=unclassified Streptomyces TaxID=2593676 RepID=UPI001C2245A3|nr:hypothetical protein [Streptomyces sp. AC558_RSS880]